MSFEPCDDLVGDAVLALDARAVDRRLAEVAQLRQELLAAAHVLGGRFRVGVDQVQPEAAQEHFLGEAGLSPVLFACGLGYFSGFALGDSHLTHLAAW